MLAGVIGMIDGSYTLASFFKSVTVGINGMLELVLLAILIGGMVEIIQYNGGIQYLMNVLTRNIRSKKGAEFGIAGLVSMTNMCTANNTISIIYRSTCRRMLQTNITLIRKNQQAVRSILL